VTPRSLVDRYQSSLQSNVCFMMKIELSSSETSASISHISQDSNNNNNSPSLLKCSFIFFIFLHFAVNLLKRFISQAFYCGDVS
jgi:hypothetical protein